MDLTERSWPGNKAIRQANQFGEVWTWATSLPRFLASSLSSKRTARFSSEEESAKGSYVVKAATELSRITGVRVEALSDTRLPKKGPGRAPNDGNFVLTELEVQAGPVADLTKWTMVKEWIFDELAENKDWQGAYGAKTVPRSGGLAVTANSSEGVLSIGEFFHAGPFVNLAFDQKAGPEGLPGFDAKQKFKHANKEISWTRKQEWKNGQLYGTVFSGDNTVNYLHKVITVDSPRDLPISLGSDDGIKVYLNGKQILANNVGRGAAPDQEKLTLNLKKEKISSSQDS